MNGLQKRKKLINGFGKYGSNECCCGGTNFQFCCKSGYYFVSKTGKVGLLKKDSQEINVIYEGDYYSYYCCNDYFALLITDDFCIVFHSGDVIYEGDYYSHYCCNDYFAIYKTAHDYMLFYIDEKISEGTLAINQQIVCHEQYLYITNVPYDNKLGLDVYYGGILIDTIHDEKIDGVYWGIIQIFEPIGGLIVLWGYSNFNTVTPSSAIVYIKDKKIQIGTLGSVDLYNNYLVSKNSVQSYRLSYVYYGDTLIYDAGPSYSFIGTITSGNLFIIRHLQTDHVFYEGNEILTFILNNNHTTYYQDNYTIEYTAGKGDLYYFGNKINEIENYRTSWFCNGYLIVATTLNHFFVYYNGNITDEFSEDIALILDNDTSCCNSGIILSSVVSNTKKFTFVYNGKKEIEGYLRNYYCCFNNRFSNQNKYLIIEFSDSQEDNYTMHLYYENKLVHSSFLVTLDQTCCCNNRVLVYNDLKMSICSVFDPDFGRMDFDSETFLRLDGIL
jgi:hypothetical protein